jgi:putative DNA primase/helicase
VNLPANQTETVTRVVTVDDPRITDELRSTIKRGVKQGRLHYTLVDLLRTKLRPADVHALVTDRDNEISRSFDNDRQALEMIKLAHEQAKRPVLGRDTWVENAHAFLTLRAPHLTYHASEFFIYGRGYYRALPDRVVQSVARQFLADSVIKVENDDGDWIDEDFNPDQRDRDELVSALRDLVNLDAANLEIDPPCWIVEDATNRPPPRACISFNNGILHVPSRVPMRPTPEFFTRVALPFDYDPQARCPLWEKTLDDWWPRKADGLQADGSQADDVLLLQEWFGYFLLPATFMQKIFAIQGDGGTGKSTIARVLKMLIGMRNITAPSLKSLAGEFGRQPLIGKQLAIFSETAFGKNEDPVSVTGYIKAISGEDTMEVNRKNKDFWIGQLLVRILMLCNKIPSFSDDSSALGRRLIVLKMRKMFRDEGANTQLTDELAKELPGILNWSLVGYDRLMKSRRFTETNESREVRDHFIRAASTVRSFVEDECVVDASADDDDKEFITEKALYAAYKNYCQEASTHHDCKKDFITAVLAFDSAINTHRPPLRDASGATLKDAAGRARGGERGFRGIQLKRVVEQRARRGETPGKAAVQEKIPF